MRRGRISAIYVNVLDLADEIEEQQDNGEEDGEYLVQISSIIVISLLSFVPTCMVYQDSRCDVFLCRDMVGPRAGAKLASSIYIHSEFAVHALLLDHADNTTSYHELNERRVILSCVCKSLTFCVLET